MPLGSSALPLPAVPARSRTATIGDLELEHHPGEGVVSIDHPEAVLFVDLGDHHTAKAGALLVSQPPTPLGRAAAGGR